MGLLDGKVALVTGATRGLGRALAQGLAEAGSSVVVSSRKPEACEAVAGEIARSCGVPTLALPLHVGHWDDIADAVDLVEARLGALDVLVNNAGIAPLAPSLLEQSESLYDKTMEVNLKGPFRLMAVAGAQMARSGGGSIINISSIGSQRPGADEATYSAAKAGLNALTQAFAQEYAPTVRVNCVMPGAFATDMAENWGAEFVSKVVDGLPAGRLGDPRELVGMVVHLASDVSSYTTGAIIPVDGGRLAVY